MLACHVPGAMACLPSTSAIRTVIPVRQRQPPVVVRRVLATLSCKKAARRRATVLVPAATNDDDLRPAINEYPEGMLSGDWPENFSLHNDADLYAYLETQIVSSDTMGSAARLMDVMSRPVQVATPGQRLAEVDAFFAAQYSGLPVVDDESRCIGVVSNKDQAKATNGMESTVGEVMSSPAIALTYDRTVLEAAALMLREKVHRIPVVNEQQQVIGILTRTDVFQALEANKA